MSLPLIDTAPGFDTPLAVLKHCHDRVRKQLQTLERLLAHLPVHGADAEAQKAAQAIVQYFDKGAPLHHEDEEQNLIPMLLATANGEDAETLARLIPGLIEEHSTMTAIWQDLHEQLAGIAEGSATFLNAADVRRFVGTYSRHMEAEETEVTPMARRLLSADQLRALGDAMQLRRGIPVAGAAAAASGPSLADLRRDYGQASLSEADVLADPIAQFAKWFDEAIRAEVAEPNAMGLSTVDEDGCPSSRIVLIKQFDQRGFTWYTNYSSAKGRQLRARPQAALLFFWSELERQIRIEGDVELTAPEDSDKYFHSRPLKSRLAAIASHQSDPIANRDALEAAYAAVEAQYGDTPPRPAHWGGYRLKPRRIEFWQGRRSRFHDRIVYTLQEDGSWKHERLQP